jgi:tRNA A-37 threonylcarbamoyl transferase component Bud32
MVVDFVKLNIMAKNASKSLIEAFQILPNHFKSAYDDIKSRILEELLLNKADIEKTYLTESFYRNIFESDVFPLLSDQAQNEVIQERNRCRSMVGSYGPVYLAFVTQNDICEVLTKRYLHELNSALTRDYIETRLSSKTITTNNRFLKEWKIDGNKESNDFHQRIHAIITITKKFHEKIKSIRQEHDGLEAKHLDQLKQSLHLDENEAYYRAFTAIAAYGKAIQNPVIENIGNLGASALELAYEAIVLAPNKQPTLTTEPGAISPYMVVAFANECLLEAVLHEHHAPTLQSLKQPLNSLQSLLSLPVNSEHVDLKNTIQSMHELTLSSTHPYFEKQEVTTGSNANLRDFTLILNALTHYLETELDAAKGSEMERSLVDLHTWLTTPSFIQLMDGQWPTPDTVGVQLDGVNRALLPNIDLLIKSIELYAKSRMHLGADKAKKSDPSYKRHHEIQDVIENAQSFMSQLKSNEIQIFETLVQQYRDTYQQMKDAVKPSALVMLNNDQIPGLEDVSQPLDYVNIYWPAEITSTIPGHNPLPFERLIHTMAAQQGLQIPRMIKNNLDMGIGRISGSYHGSAHPASRGYDDSPGHWLCRHWIISRGASYNITINYELNGHSITLFTASATLPQGRIHDTLIYEYGRDDYHPAQGRYYDQLVNQINVIPENVFLANAWASATLSAISTPASQPIPEPLRSVMNNAMMNVYESQAPINEASKAVWTKIVDHAMSDHTAFDASTANLTRIKESLRQYARFLQSPLIQAMESLWSGQDFLSSSIGYHNQQSHVGSIIVSENQGSNRTAEQLNYCSSILDAIKAHEALSEHNDAAQRIASLQVDEAIILDEKSIQCDLNDLLGQGSFGQVYKAKMNVGNVVQDVAIKLPYNGGKLGEDAKRELNVISALSKAEHPCEFLVRVMGVTQFKGRPGIVMEYLPNGTLDDSLHGDEPLDWNTRHLVSQEVIAGLFYLHLHQIVHGDLKTPNIMLTHDNHAKIMDYGLSQVSSTTQLRSTRPHPSRGTSQSSKSIATPHAGTNVYCAPEFFDNDELRPNRQTDVYALGVILWQIATGLVPFYKTDGSDKAINAFWNKVFLNDPNKPATDHFDMPVPSAEKGVAAKNLHTFLSPLVKSCRQFNPAHRPSAAQLVDHCADVKQIVKAWRPN